MGEDNGLLSFNDLDKIMKDLAKIEQDPKEMADSLIQGLKSYGIDMNIDQETGSKIDIDLHDTNIIEAAATFSEILKYYVDKEPGLRIDARLSLFNPGTMPEVDSQEEPQGEPNLFAINKDLLILHYNWESAVNYYFTDVAPQLFNQRDKIHQWDSLSGDIYTLDDVTINGPNDEPYTIREALHNKFVSVPDYIEF